MINVKELKLKRIFSLKAYLEEKARRDREYREYVENAIREGEADFAAGKYYTLEELKAEFAKDIEEFEMMQNE